ncbi:MAG: ubiquitin carboxyl-terminal hydrolase, partial [Acidimicrobiales bacterium]
EQTAESFTQYLLKHSSEVSNWKHEECNTITPSGLDISLLKHISAICVIMFNKYTTNTHSQLNWFPTSFEIPTVNTASPTFKYKLVGMIMHSGSTMGGHYISQAIRRNSSIYQFNDMHFTPIPEFVPNAATYIIFYVRDEI